MSRRKRKETPDLDRAEVTRRDRDRGVLGIAVILLLNALFYRTALGRAFRATSDDVEIAQLMGINNRSIYALTMGISLAVCALAAFFLGTRANFDPSIGPARLLYAFEAVIIGGLGSLWGTLLGGMVLAEVKPQAEPVEVPGPHDDISAPQP